MGTYNAAGDDEADAMVGRDDEGVGGEALSGSVRMSSSNIGPSGGSTCVSSEGVLHSLVVGLASPMRVPEGFNVSGRWFSGKQPMGR